MSDPTLRAQIEAAQAYEALFVPALFAQWAPQMADTARIRRGGRVLDVGCGTGVVAREVAARLESTGRVVGIDRGPGMLEVARQRAPALEWREGVAESLPFADGSFDAVVSQFALMFFTDRPRALREMMRVLAPGGRLVVAVWDSLHSMPAYAAEVALLARTAGQAAADALSAPFVLGDRHRLGELFEEAGVSAVDVTTRPGTARFPSLRTLVEADLRGWLPLVGIVLAEDLIGRILQEAEKELAAYATTDGRAEFGLSTLFATATKA